MIIKSVEVQIVKNIFTSICSFYENMEPNQLYFVFRAKFK